MPPQSHDDDLKLDPEKWEALTEHLKERTNNKFNQNCDIANTLVENFIEGAVIDDELFSKLPRELQILLENIMHVFAHYAFEYGRQFELDHTSLPDNFDDLTVEDL